MRWKSLIWGPHAARATPGLAAAAAAHSPGMEAGTLLPDRGRQDGRLGRGRRGAELPGLAAPPLVRGADCVHLALGRLHGGLGLGLDVALRRRDPDRHVVEV